MSKKSIFLLVLATLLIPYAFACVEPSEGLQITEDTILCPGEYNLNHGLNIAEDNILIQCNETVINGYINQFAFSIENRKNITIKDCQINEFQAGIAIINSININILNNHFNDNELGIFFSESFLVNISTNNFHNNTINSIFMGNESRGNNFENNHFNISAFNFIKAENQPYNNYTNNTYVQAEVPNDYITEYVHHIEEQIHDEETSEQQPEDDEAEATIETFSTAGSGNPEDILRELYDAMELNERSFQQDLDDMQKTIENTKITKRFDVNNKENTTKVTTSIKIKEDMPKLQAFELIPKSIAKSASKEITFHEENYIIIKDDPLIMWEYNDLKAGDTVEKSYTVGKIIKEEEDEKPTTTVCINCAQKKSRYNFLIPLILIPIIIFGFIFFERFQHKLE